MRSRLLTVPVVLAGMLLMPCGALGHSELDTATPGAGDEVVGSPDDIVATFSQDLDMSRTTMTVRNAAGEVVAEDPVLGDGPRELILTLPELAPGEYEVRWVSFSAEDDELGRGRYTFTVLPAPTPTPSSNVTATAAPTTAPVTAPPPTSGPTPVASLPPGPDDGGVAALLPIGIAAVVVIGLGAWLLRRR